MTALAWEGCLNVRDLGGLPTEDGRAYASRRASFAPTTSATLTDAGWRALADHGVTRIVDLRWPEELAEDQPRDVDDRRRARLGARRRTRRGLRRGARRAPGLGRRRRRPLRLVVRRLPRALPRALRAARSRRSPTPTAPCVVHCMGGKDRTGLVSALLLRLAGVDARRDRRRLRRDRREPRAVDSGSGSPAVADEVERAKWQRLAADAGRRRWSASCRRSRRATATSRRTCAPPASATSRSMRLRERLVAP